MADYNLLIKNGTIVDWLRVQKAEGYHFTIVNGVITFEGQRCTGTATSVDW